MGEALIKGLHKTHRILVCEANAQRAKFLQKKYGITTTNINTAVQFSSTVIFAVKPQDMGYVLDNICRGESCIRPFGRWQASPLQNKLFISIAAGLTTKFFEKHLRKVRLIRCMPNMPALIGEGITAICAGQYATAINVRAAQKILQTIGQTVVVKESMINAVTAVSGSGPAYVFLFVQAWIAAAKKLGFKEAEARQLVYKTLLGSSHLLEKSKFDAATLRAKVTSKGGTTQAAMGVFFKRKFDPMMQEALLAAKKRAKELAR